MSVQVSDAVPLQDVERLQASIHELYDMFMDLASIIHKSGEVLNSVEMNVHTASKYVLLIVLCVAQ